MKLTIEIELGNEAMQTLADAVDAITRSSLVHSHPHADVGNSGKIRDENGNTVGTWTVSE